MVHVTSSYSMAIYAGEAFCKQDIICMLTCDTAGISVLLFALFMSARMGLYQEVIYATYGKHPREALFFTVSWVGTINRLNLGILTKQARHIWFFERWVFCLAYLALLAVAGIRTSDDRFGTAHHNCKQLCTRGPIRNGCSISLVVHGRERAYSVIHSSSSFARVTHPANSKWQMSECSQAPSAFVFTSACAEADASW